MVPGGVEPGGRTRSGDHVGIQQQQPGVLLDSVLADADADGNALDDVDAYDVDCVIGAPLGSVVGALFSSGCTV